MVHVDRVMGICQEQEGSTQLTFAKYFSSLYIVSHLIFTKSSSVWLYAAISQCLKLDKG